VLLCLFTAARAALEKAGVKPTEPRLAFGHGFIQAHFVGELIGKKSAILPSFEIRWRGFSCFDRWQTMKRSLSLKPWQNGHCAGQSNLSLLFRKE
jgi:hypothetical protein